MFRCKVCEEKNLRISDLQKQIGYLKSLATPSFQIPLINQEANNIMNGAGQDVPDLTPEQLAEEERITLERNALLSGNYS